eukprot:scaffold608780_cov38-Prasinocladus_malaysianus.AAC.1
MAHINFALMAWTLPGDCSTAQSEPVAELMALLAESEVDWNASTAGSSSAYDLAFPELEPQLLEALQAVLASFDGSGPPPPEPE